MNQGKLVFAQLMQHLPLTTFRRCVTRYQGEWKVKSFSCLDQFLSMAFADPSQARLHQIDQEASGRVQIAAEVTNPATRDRYLVNSLIEEAITSSQLEGASTTHKVAKSMLREGRRPRDKSEQMIFNNYRAMNFIRDIADDPLTKEILLELHRTLTEKTLDDSTAEGRFRTRADNVAVHDARDNTLFIAHSARRR